MRATPIVFVVCGLVAGASAQTPPPNPNTAPPAAAAAPANSGGQKAAPDPGAPAQDNYTYDPAGRRDPFLTLIGAGVEPRAPVKRGEGSTGLLVAEISVRGVVQGRGSLVAMVQGPDNRTYLMHTGDKLVDGTIKAVTPQGLIIMQEVNDPLSLVKQREVRKLLRSFEDAKP
jgi:hypothetical protein